MAAPNPRPGLPAPGQPFGVGLEGPGGDAARRYLVYLLNHPDERIQGDAPGGAIYVPNGEGGEMARLVLSVYEMGGFFHAMNHPQKSAHACLAYAKGMKEAEDDEAKNAAGKE